MLADYSLRLTVKTEITAGPFSNTEKSSGFFPVMLQRIVRWVKSCSIAAMLKWLPTNLKWHWPGSQILRKLRPAATALRRPSALIDLLIHDLLIHNPSLKALPYFASSNT